MTKATSVIRHAIDLLEPDLVELRRDLHRHPELGFEELRTASVIADKMRATGPEVRTGVGDTGVLADLSGAEAGPTLLAALGPGS